jgi:hypothetical protein
MHKHITRSATRDKNSCTKHCLPVCVMANKTENKKELKICCRLLHLTVATFTAAANYMATSVLMQFTPSNQLILSTYCSAWFLAFLILVDFQLPFTTYIPSHSNFQPKFNTVILTHWISGAQCASKGNVCISCDCIVMRWSYKQNKGQNKTVVIYHTN